MLMMCRLRGEDGAEGGKGRIWEVDEGVDVLYAAGAMGVAEQSQ